ncbi:carbohydrate ABC transporter permease [Kitasatospora herbaricolor]|uniref:carbohydrate ABC transporter permease n=1 Tax=Kitasatospora herbaricolor TaxID=68217 RepID=UPI0036DA0945
MSAVTSTRVDSAADSAAPAPARKLRQKIKPSRVILGIVGVVISLIWVFPVYWMVNSSLLPNVVLQNTTPTWLPFGGSWDNFAAVINGGTFFPALGMSLVIAIVTVVFCIVFAFLAALAISRFKFRGRKSFVLAVLLIQMLPAEGLFIAQYKLMGSLNLLNTVLGVSIIYIAAVVPFTIWMLRGFVAAVPVELEEAAYLDGASWWRMFRSVLFPLVMPGLVATSVFSFITAWNEFIFAMTLLGGASDQYTVAIGLKQFFGEHTNEWGYVMAASTIITIPVMIFFVLVQRKLSSGLVAGAVKG